MYFTRVLCLRVFEGPDRPSALVTNAPEKTAIIRATLCISLAARRQSQREQSIASQMVKKLMPPKRKGSKKGRKKGLAGARKASTALNAIIHLRKRATCKWKRWEMREIRWNGVLISCHTIAERHRQPLPTLSDEHRTFTKTLKIK